MRLLILCAIFSVLLTVSLAGPVKTQIRDAVVDSSSSNSDESVENKNNLSSSEEVEDKIKTENNDSSISNEEEGYKNKNIVKDDNNEANSIEDDKLETKNQRMIVVSDEDEILDLHKLVHKSKRSLNVDYISNSNNNLHVRDEGSIKYEKYLKLKRLRRDFESNESNDSNDIKPRLVRSAESSEENSSEENKKNSAKSETAAAESSPKAEEPQAESAKAEAARRRRNADSSEENSFEEDEKPKKDIDNSASREDNQFNLNQNMNEVYVFSNENQQDSEESFKIKTLKNTKYVVLSENNLDKSLEKKQNSDEDYAQGCGNNDDDSSGNSNENNETNFNE